MIERIFLGAAQPALRAAAERLIAEFAEGGQCDLGGLLVVTPSLRAGRRLMEILVALCEERKLALWPPDNTPAVNLAERLCRPSPPIASDLEMRLAWEQSLRNPAAGGLRAHIRDLSNGDDASYAALAEMFARLHEEVGSEGLDFSRLTERLETLDVGKREVERWQSFAALEREYLKTLEAAGRSDARHAQQEALAAGAARSDQEIVLLGVTDLEPIARGLLAQVAEKAKVVAMIAADENCATRYEEFGLIRVEEWMQVTPPLATDQLRVAEGPAEQAEAVFDALGELKGAHPIDAITVGVADPSLAPYLAEVAREQGYETHWAQSAMLARSAPAMLLAAAADYLQTRSFRDFAALVRHPDMERNLSAMLKELSGGAPSPWLVQLDAYRQEHLPQVADGVWLGESKSFALVEQAHQACEAWLRTLAGAARPIVQWMQPIVDCLAAVYGLRAVQPDRAADALLIGACEKLIDAIRNLAALAPQLAPDKTAAETIRLLLDEISGTPVPRDTASDALELVSWRDLPLDDARALVIAGFNDGFVPQSVNSDPFLPNGLRTALGFVDNDRRFARDVCALTMILQSRPDAAFICGRHSDKFEPLAPSRLFFACDDSRLVERVRKFWRPERGPARGRYRIASGNVSKFIVPELPPLAAPIERLHVTAFRSFLACPYRFYLSHVLRLDAIDDDLEELDNAAFGSFAHHVLEAFGKSDERDSMDAERIEKFLSAECDRRMRAWYGEAPLAAIRVQIEQLRRRLAAFAQWQAKWAREGWRIENVELYVKAPGVDFPVDGAPFGLLGRIDRIDVNERTGERRIFDYKTSETARKPEAVHRTKSGDWVDLQLPLYRYLAQSAAVSGVGLGYILLPKDVTACAHEVATWSEDELESADEAARNIIRALRTGDFGKPVKPAPMFSEAFAAICQDGQYGGAFASLAEEESWE